MVRLHDPLAADLGVDRRREAILHAAAAGRRSRQPHPGNGIRQARYLITEFLDGAPWRAIDIEDENRLWALAQTLSELHALPAPEVAPLDLPTLLERHLGRIAEQDVTAAQELKPQVARAQDILARQADAGRPACIVPRRSHAWRT